MAEKFRIADFCFRRLQDLLLLRLDSASGEEILGILGELNRAGKTIVMITHNEKTAKQAQRLIRISDGKIL